MRKIKSLMIALSVSIVSLGAGLGLFSAQADTSVGNTLKLTADIFSPSNLTVQSAVIPEEAVSLNPGLLLSTNSGVASAQLRETYAGDFAFCYAPVIKYGVSVIKKAEVIFEDKTGENDFKIVITHNALTTDVSVAFGNTQAGIFYSPSGEMEGQTSFANSEGLYTQVASNELSVYFDAESQSVYAGANEANRSLVWNMSETSNDGLDVNETLGDISTYTVSFNIVEVSGNQGGFVLYSINDCVLDGIILENTGTPMIYADFSSYGLVGSRYTIPKAYGCDVWDGLLETTYKVFSPNWTEIFVGKDGIFVPSVEGDYKVIYTTKNSSGLEITQEYALKVYSEMPDYTYQIDEEIPITADIGESVYVPKMFLRGGLNIRETRIANVTIYKNNIKLLVYADRKSGFDFIVSHAGDYKFSYDIGNGKTVDYYMDVFPKEAFLRANYSKKPIIGEIVDVSQGYVEVNGEQLPFEFQVTYPDGNVYSNKKFQCNQVGVYGLRATAILEGQTYVVEEKIDVELRGQDMFSTTSNSASVTYGKSTFSGLAGVRLTTSQSYTQFSYSKPIDISKYKNQTKETKEPVYGEKNVLLADNAQPFIELSVDPYAYGQAAIGRLSQDGIYVYLTDAADPTNVMTICVHHVGEETWSYVLASAGNQELSGFFNERDRAVSPSGGDYYAYGFRIIHSFLGKGNILTSDNKISLYYDYEENKLLSNSCQYRNNDNSCPNDTVKDFDNADFAFGSIWDGFKSDKVYLSIGFQSLSNQASCMIYSIDGVKFSSEVLAYETEPVIEIDISKNQELYAVKGYEFTIPSATAIDCFGKEIEQIQFAVFFEKNGQRYNVSAKNGTFHVEETGRYYVCYRAKDCYGNISKCEIAITAIENVNKMTAYSTMDIEPDWVTGVEFHLAPMKAIIVENAIGLTTITREILLNGNLIESQGDSFVPQEAGNYTVKYTATDYVGRTATVEYLIDVAVNPNPVIVSSIPTYVAFVRGNTYSLFDIYLIDYKESNEAVKADIYINGEKYINKIYTPADYTLKVGESDNNEIVTIEYRYQNNTLLYYNVPVNTVYKEVIINDENFGAYTKKQYLLDKYFKLDSGAELTLLNGYLLLKSKEDNATATFAQGLNSSNLDLVFDIAKEKAVDLSELEENIQNITIRIIDSQDSSKTVSMSVCRKNNETTFYFNGKEGLSRIKGSLLGTSLENFRLKLNAETGKVIDNNTGYTLANIEKYENGTIYDGFSEKVYISFAVESTDGKETQIKIISIAGQAFSFNAKEDTLAPSLTVDDCSGVYEINSQMTLPVASAFDVLSDVKDILLTLTYTSKSGETSIVTDINGNQIANVDATKAYTFIFDKLGEYKVTYTATDSRNNGANQAIRSFTMTTKVSSKPIVNISGTMHTSVAAGTTVALPTMTVVWGEESENNLSYIVVISSTNEYRLLKTNQFTLTKKGIYTIRYYALDSYGNYTMIEYKIISK